jgi:hypothetical protein
MFLALAPIQIHDHTYNMVGIYLRELGSNTSCILHNSK